MVSMVRQKHGKGWSTLVGHSVQPFSLHGVDALPQSEPPFHFAPGTLSACTHSTGVIQAWHNYLKEQDSAYTFINL